MSLDDLRKQWREANRRGASQDPGTAEHFVLAATFTAEPIVPYLGAKYIGDGSAVPTITIAPYDQLFQVCYNWKEMFPGDTPTALIIVWRIEDYLRTELQSFLRGGRESLNHALNKLAELSAAIASLRQSFGGTIVVSIPPFPHGPDHHIKAARTAMTAGMFHRRVVDTWCSSMDRISGIFLLDLDASQRNVGIEKSCDSRKWYLYRQPYTEEFWHDAADSLNEIFKRQRNASKKCLVVDCDNTLWGGIVGEDGLDSIALGEDFPGSAFRDFQQQMLTLRSNGVMLAICSKNNEPDVWEVFDRHDGMVLKREHFVAHRINWTGKPTNIESIAKELNIGLDSMVFVDDSSIEIEFVRESLPMVTCIKVPMDPARFSETINSIRLFDRDHVSEEDLVRSEMMLQERERKTLETSLSAEDFTKRLNLTVDFFQVKPEHVTRVTQLLNKTNQFNLTTRRKTAGEVLALCNSPQSGVFAWRVADRFGDYGLVGVVILKPAAESVEIETFLMSCRVLGRGVEDAVLGAIVTCARRWGAAGIRGQYVPTPKNSLVANLYRNHGFKELGDGYWEANDLARFSWPVHINRAGL
jgi:FkbH-like protein